MSEQYLTIMQESLKKKIDVLDEIIRISKMQEEIVSVEPIDYEAFDRCVDDKDVCIEQLELLDKGFDTLYYKVERELKDNSASHVSWIQETKRLISLVTERSVAIQAMEARNKQAIEAGVRKSRQEFRLGKRSVDVARNYYQNMNLTGVVPPQYMDQKK
jgi:hypothetical protein